MVNLSEKLSEQVKIINTSKQDLCRLNRENLTLKSQISELEGKVFSIEKSHGNRNKSINSEMVKENPVDRPTPGGGILAYIKSDLPAKHLPELEEEGKEALWLLLKPPRTQRPYSSVIVVGVYHPPGQSKENELEMLDYLTQKMDIALAEHPSAGIFVTGDFNKLDLNPLCRCFNLRKQVKSPTRGKNLLDQILTNMSDLYDEVLHIPPIGRSDHQCLILPPKTRQKMPRFKEISTNETRELKRSGTENES